MPAITLPAFDTQAPGSIARPFFLAAVFQAACLGGLLLAQAFMAPGIVFNALTIFCLVGALGFAIAGLAMAADRYHRHRDRIIGQLTAQGMIERTSVNKATDMLAWPAWSTLMTGMFLTLLFTTGGVSSVWAYVAPTFFAA